MKLHLVVPLKTFHHLFAGIVLSAFLEDRFEILMLTKSCPSANKSSISDTRKEEF